MLTWQSGATFGESHRAGLERRRGQRQQRGGLGRVEHHLGLGALGASNTKARKTSTWRMEMSHQVPAGPVGLGQRQPRPPALAEPPDLPRPQAVAEPLQSGRVLGGGETVVQLGEPDPRSGRRALDNLSGQRESSHVRS